MEMDRMRVASEIRDLPDLGRARCYQLSRGVLIHSPERAGHQLLIRAQKLNQPSMAIERFIQCQLPRNCSRRKRRYSERYQKRVVSACQVCRLIDAESRIFTRCG